MDEQILALITAHLDGSATPAQEAQLQQWRQQSPDNEQELERLTTLWNQSGELGHLAQVDLQADWAEVQQHIQEKTPSRKRYRWQMAAALALLLVGASIIAMFFPPSESTRYAYATIGTTRTITLPDGSQVHLNKKSSLLLDEDFGEHNRKMVLSGEAYFEVTPDAQKPFIVSCGGAETKVLGTAFNLKQEAHATSIWVTHGKVAFSSDSDQLTLTKGMAAIANSDSVFYRTADPNLLAWHTEVLRFDKELLNEVFPVLEKHYSVTIDYADLSPDLRLTAVFDDMTIEEVLDEIALIHNLTWEKIAAKTYRWKPAQP